jgi:hypothetical protein
MKPEWLKNLGYVEERAPIYALLDTRPEIKELRGGWDLLPDAEDAGLLRHLSKADLRDYSGLTGHAHGFGTYNKSPQRFVKDYIYRNQPITERAPYFPKPNRVDKMARIQGATDGSLNHLGRCPRLVVFWPFRPPEDSNISIFCLDKVVMVLKKDMSNFSTILLALDISTRGIL